ncbi:predicted protein [Chaetomium globosum CBS 148.51]|uniref:Uncharacterized protein n=1 Tax=Chaetomium globosum (strain ATCC 6205 / CBS 148.51 / DSM 1962 / NBRC 6347 / NRRL 1970) TaxID=306901 RepID=Q2H7Q6_CHAGB|nr:uncharacterized protein CHGG_05309 [Chaetomium globosum CBS 148.51]EAQ88690.1 predicted protein [Chaetomium globosum CBS 148.51]
MVPVLIGMLGDDSVVLRLTSLGNPLVLELRSPGTCSGIPPNECEPAPCRITQSSVDTARSVAELMTLGQAMQQSSNLVY